MELTRRKIFCRYLQKTLDALYGEIAALVIAVGALLADYFSGCLIIHRITNNLPLSAIEIVALLVLIVLGERSTSVFCRRLFN